MLQHSNHSQMFGVKERKIIFDQLEFENKQFLISKKSMNIAEHHEFCHSNGMSIAFIRDEAENNYLMKKNIGFLRLGVVWNQSKNSFEWGDGSEMNYTNWKWDWNYQVNCTNRCCTVLMDQKGEWNICDCECVNINIYALCQQIIRTSIIISNKNNQLKLGKEELNHKYLLSQLFILLFVPIVMFIICIGYKYYKMKHVFYVNRTGFTETYVKSSISANKI